MTYQVLSHTADTGLEATSPTLGGLLQALAEGMFALVADTSAATPAEQVTLEVQAGTLEDLVVDSLSELLYLAEVRDLVLGDLHVEADPDRLSVDLRAGGFPVADTETVGPAIKAVTYHGLVVERRGDAWFGRVYFDV